jgi:hypothetical protein
MPNALYLQKEYPYESTDSAAVFRYQLTEAICNERHEVFLHNCRMGFGSETFICRDCLTEYLEKQFEKSNERKTAEHSLLVTRYIANGLALTLRQPDLHKIYIMERCPYFHYLLQDVGGESPKVSYPGRKLHRYDNDHDKRMLEGFTTDLPHVVAHFRQDVEMCRGAILPEFNGYVAEKIRGYFFSLFEEHGLASSLKKELDFLLDSDKLFFYQ